VYLVHARLRAPTATAVLPSAMADLVLAHGRPEDRVEHISFHPLADPHPVLGLWLLAESSAEATARAAALCARAVAASALLRGWLLSDVGPPPPAPCGHGPFGPAEAPSGPAPARGT
jgi:hypothetical protein